MPSAETSHRQFGSGQPPWWSQLNTSDKIGFSVLIVAIITLIVAVATLVYTTKQLAIAVKGTHSKILSGSGLFS
jgi:hypothetical protein